MEHIKGPNSKVSFDAAQSQHKPYRETARKQDQIAVLYLNGLFRNFSEHKPKVYLLDDDGFGDYHPAIPEIYVLNPDNLFMFLAWFHPEENQLFDRQNYKWIKENEFKDWMWCYKSELFPDTWLVNEIWSHNGKKLALSEQEHSDFMDDIDDAIQKLENMKRMLNNQPKLKK